MRKVAELVSSILNNQSAMQEANSSGGCSVVNIVVLLGNISNISALDEDGLLLYLLFWFWADVKI